MVGLKASACNRWAFLTLLCHCDCLVLYPVRDYDTAAGALFGLGWGLLSFSFASSIGATCVLVLVTLARTCAKRFGDRLSDQ